MRTGSFQTQTANVIWSEEKPSLDFRARRRRRRRQKREEGKEDKMKNQFSAKDLISKRVVCTALVS